MDLDWDRHLLEIKLQIKWKNETKKALGFIVAEGMTVCYSADITSSFQVTRVVSLLSETMHTLLMC